MWGDGAIYLSGRQEIKKLTLERIFSTENVTIMA